MGSLNIVQTVNGIAERQGGTSRSVRALCEALARQGATVTLVAGCDRSRDDALLVPDPALVRAEILPVPTRLGAVAAAVRAAVLGDPAFRGATVIHDNGIWTRANFAATRAARTLAVPYIISPHGMLEPWALAFHARRKRLAWFAYQRRSLALAAGLLATADQELASIRVHFPNIPVAVIPNGVDFPDGVADRSATADNRVLFMSRLHPKKNLVGLINAWARLCANPAFASWTLDVAGPDEGGHLQQVRAEVARLRLTDRVSFLGIIPEDRKPDVFANADIFILPSFSENFGIVVAEALAHGVPVVATQGTPWSELVANGCGWWVAPDADGLAGALSSAMALDHDARRAMGGRGRQFAMARFGWDRIGLQMMQYYHWILHRGPVPDFVDV